MTAAAASGVFAMVALTGCLGEDDKDNKTLTPPTMPKFTMPELDIPDIDVPDLPSGVPTSTKKPTGTKNPTSTSTSSSVESVDLKAGECIDTSATGEISKKSCSGPHSGEVGAVLTLPESASPSSPNFKQTVDSMCEDEVGPIIDRQSNASSLSFSMYYPQLSSWMDGDRTLQCIIEREDGGKLTAKLR